MSATKALCALWFLTLLACPILRAGERAALENGRYRIEIRPSGDIEIRVIGSPVRRQFSPAFTILYSGQDPDLAYQLDAEEAYLVPSWKSPRGARTMDLFQAAERSETARAHGGTLKNGVVYWDFPEGELGKLEADLTLPPGSGDARISFRFTPQRPGWYSVGYTGAPSVTPGEVEALWQPLVWQERRFPRMAFLSVERMCSLPAVIVVSGGASVAVAADPKEVPFRIPSFEDSRFGVLLRNPNGLAQPAIFAPIFGHPSKEAQKRDQTEPWRYGNEPRPQLPTGLRSYRKAGESFSFRLCIVVQAGGWYPAFRQIAERIYGFHDYRENTTGSLNDTIENMIAFAMDDRYSGWVEDLKGFDYATDVPGTVKVVSALHPLSIALMTDDREVFRQRALPMTEFLMSRQKYLYSDRAGITHQSPSHLLRGPAPEVSELSALYLMSQDRSAVFRHYAELLNVTPRTLNLNMVSEGGSWQNRLALYRMTGNQADLAEARRGADRYIEERIAKLPQDFADVRVAQGGQFWTDFTPTWIDLFELYEETGAPRYLEAAATGAREYSSIAWLQPSIPDREVSINAHDQVGIHMNTHARKASIPMRAPAQSVPAWRLSQIGLLPEASTTYASNAAVLLAPHAAYLLRVAAATQDSFLRALARSAVVGRYANYPGYSIQGELTTIYERFDYPLRPFDELSYNYIFYNHVWPQIASLFDYLISDVFARSGGAIAFPSRYAQGYSYLKSKVYGDRPGVFYGHEGVQLWMPAKLARIDNVQVNYLAGYDRDTLYLALSNQCARPMTAHVQINPDLAPYAPSREYTVRTWQSNRPGADTAMRHGEIVVNIPAAGLTAVAIEGIRVVPQFQNEALAHSAPLSGQSYTERETSFGKVTGMMLAFGAAAPTAYVWLGATEEQVTSARLHYRVGDSEWSTAEDNHYPFEFSIPSPVSKGEFSYWVEVITPQGGSEKSATDTLQF